MTILIVWTFFRGVKIAGPFLEALNAVFKLPIEPKEEVTRVSHVSERERVTTFLPSALARRQERSLAT